MAFSVGDIVRIVCKMAYGEGDIQNVFHAKIEGSNLPSYADFLNKVKIDLTDVYDNIIAAVPQDVSFVSMDMYNVTKDEFIGTTNWYGMPSGEAVPGYMPPPQCAPLVKFASTALRSVGKKFLPPFDTARIDADGTINATGLVEMGNFVAQILLGIGDTGDWWIWFGNWNPTLARFAQWTSGVVRDLFATQRRRYIGRGS